MCRRKQHGERAAGRGGRRGKALNLWTFPEGRAHRHSGRRRARTGRETVTSKQRKLERKRAAAGTRRKVRRRKEEGRNSNYRLDFGAREPLHATASSAKAEPRQCGWRCLYGRRTSQRAKTKPMEPNAESIAQSRIFPLAVGPAAAHKTAHAGASVRAGLPAPDTKLAKRRRPCKLPRDAGFQPLSRTQRGRRATA